VDAGGARPSPNGNVSWLLTGSGVQPSTWTGGLAVLPSKHGSSPIVVSSATMPSNGSSSSAAVIAPNWSDIGLTNTLDRSNCTALVPLRPARPGNELFKSRSS
jgi:Tol biopolymer transport system component